MSAPARTLLKRLDRRSAFRHAGRIRLIPIGLLLFLTACANPRSDDAATGDSGKQSEEGAAPNLAIHNAVHPLPGVLSGGQPTKEQFARAKELGFKTVINLRADGEEGVAEEGPYVESLGLTYVHIPVSGKEDINEQNARALFQAVSKSERPLLIHCASGNRVGALVAIKAALMDGKPTEEAIGAGRQAGLTRLEPTVRELLEGR